MNVRMSCVVRRDLSMSPGLLSAQVAHISALWLHRLLEAAPAKGNKKRHVDVTIELSNEERQWLNGPVLSVLAVDTPEELDVVVKKAREVGVEVQTWRDTIRSQVFSSPEKPVYLEVIVGASFGPDDEEKIKQVTGSLPLY